LVGELNRLCGDPSQRVRVAVYRVLSRHGLRAAAPNIVRQIKAPSFNTIEPEERRELFIALLKLSPERGEEMALELARKGGLLTSENRETTRIAAIEALGEVCRTFHAAASLREVAQSRWGTSDETRTKAAAAAGQIEQRLAGPMEGMT
jgi:HEAT repeat protein